MSEGWTHICDLDDVLSGAGVCAMVNGRQIAVFRIADAVFAVDNLDPASQANVLSRGLVGDLKGERVVASPIYKHHYSLTTGQCLEDPEKRVHVHRARVLDGRIWVKVGGETVRTTCPYCGVGCGVLARNANGAVEIAGDTQHPANFGALCSKGYALGETLGLKGRLLRPQVNGRQATWDDALDHVGNEFKRIIATHGPDSVAFYVSGQLLTEDYYVANKLMKGYIGSANIDTNSRLCMASSVVGHKRAFGEDLVPTCYEDLEVADLIVLVGSNTAWCHPVLFRRIAEEKERRPDLRIVVIDPRHTPTCELADLHLPIRGGTDIWLFNGLLAYLQRHSLSNTQFVANHTAGAQSALEAAAGSADDATVAHLCGIDVARLTEFYALFAAHERVVTAYSQGVNQSSAGTDKVNSIINCHLLTGRIGQPGMGPFSLTGQPNAMGGREVGGMATTLAAHMDVEDPVHRAIVQTFWNSPRVASTAGLKAVELFEAMHEGKIKAVWIMGTNPLVSMPDANRVRAALERCELVVVSDCTAKTDTTAHAHVLLPAAAWGEKDGTVTNSERSISRQRNFLDLPDGARPDWWIICEVAKRLGFAEAFDFRSPAQIFDEHARLSGAANNGTRAFDISGLAGMTAAAYERLEPVQWPLSRRNPNAALAASDVPRQGTQRLFEDRRFMHPDGRARLIPTPPQRPAHELSDEFPFVLNTGRIRDQWHTMTRTGLSARLAEYLPEPFIDIHPQDALLSAARDGELARVTTRWGSMVVRVRSSGEIARGTVFAPIHWNDSYASEARVCALVSPAVDSLSGEPEFKHTPVRVEPFPVEWYGFVLTRHELTSLDVTWWTRVNAAHCTRYEIAGRRRPVAWTDWGRKLLGAADQGADYIEFEDPAACVYRAAYMVDGQLEACVYIANRTDLPDRALLSKLFTVEKFEATHRMAALTTGAVVEGEEPGPLVCSCFAVGRNTIQRAIEEQNLTDVRQVGACLRAGTNCGSCLPEIQALLGAVPNRTPVSTSTALPLTT